MGWNRIIIDVDYWPADPGCTDVYTQRTIKNRKVLEVGKTISYDDPSDIMPSITVIDLDDAGITLATSEMTVRLPDGKGNKQAKLAEGGRDYTNFQLWVRMETCIDVTHDLAFLRKFYHAHQIAMLSEADVEALRDADDPYAKYAYARWLIITNPEKGFCQSIRTIQNCGGGWLCRCVAGLVVYVRLWRCRCR